MQNIGNHSSRSQFSNESCFLCFLLPSFERALHLCFFPRCAAGGLFGKSQSTLWKSEASSTLLSMVPVLPDAQNQSTEVSKVKVVVLIYRQLNPRCLQRVSLQVAHSSTPKRLYSLCASLQNKRTQASIPGWVLMYSYNIVYCQLRM